MQMKAPSNPLPQPLRASERPSFTHYSVVVRLPDIARRTLADNDFPPETVKRIENLIVEIPSGKIRPIEISDQSVRRQWADYIQPYQGQDWLEASWFFVEQYFYIRILEATGYFDSGDGYRRDPFTHQKHLGLESTRSDISTLTDQTTTALTEPPETYLDSLSRLLLADLWGNQNDLSLWPVQEDSTGQGHSGGSAVSGAKKTPKQAGSETEIWAAGDHLLVDDRPNLLHFLSDQRKTPVRVDIVLDNAGYELVTDLALADFLLTNQTANEIILHGKSQPVFVSDAVDYDIHQTLDFLTFAPHEPTRQMGVRLRQSLVSDQLKLQFHPFWASPLPAWEMPDDLASQINQAHLLISKGDANYRRLLGDRHWPLEMPFPDVVNYFSPAVLSLRTLKSEIAVGIPRDRIPSADTDWMINGRWGLIQFAPPGPTN